MDFTTRYNMLNDSQRQAVDTIDGPIMVVAGPGTGKTELLGMRTANILRRTDTLPENILLLTFTESGTIAMRQRLVSILGKDAYKIAIYTFHGFATEIFNQYATHFYRGASFQPADELRTYEILTNIFASLDHTTVLGSKMNDEFTYLHDVKSVISELKRAGLTSDELLDILAKNDIAIDTIEPYLTAIFEKRISKATITELETILPSFDTIDDVQALPSVEQLSHILKHSLQSALNLAVDGNTKPITAWKQAHMKKNDSGVFVLKAREQVIKLRDVSYIYYRYMQELESAGLYDFDDMILQLVHTLEYDNDLRFNLQEQYQYIMVDEFQDTNLAQMRILMSLLDNPVHEGRPNILIVGDDDQAIYSFQGADVSNMLTFRSLYREVMLIVLTDNYRSSTNILEAARHVITQGTERLEHTIEGISKQLVAHRSDETAQQTTYTQYDTQHDEYSQLARHIRERIESGSLPESIAVLSRRHRDLVVLLPYFQAADVPVSYERQSNVFSIDSIKVLVQLARVVDLLSNNQHDQAQALLPDLLSHPAWGITTATLWRISTKAYENRELWLQTMQTLPETTALAGWLIEQSVQARTSSIEHILDTLLGSEPSQSYTSPLFDYFFSAKNRDDHPSQYIQHINALRTLRAKLRDYSGDDNTLAQFISYIDLYDQTGTSLTIMTAIHPETTSGVQLMTAHGSKGLEFEYVYIMGASDAVWGEKARSYARKISYPENLPLTPAGESFDERLRLFFVGMTRAKRQLSISYSTTADTGRQTLGGGFIDSTSWETGVSAGQLSIETTLQDWRQTIDLTEPSFLAILQPLLEKFTLSATALNNFVDVPNGGPQYFLSQNLLHFPRSIMPHAAYGTAVHAALQQAHIHLLANGTRRPTEDTLHDFEELMRQQRFSSDQERQLFLARGADALTTFLASDQARFTSTQKVEFSFAGQGVVVDGARLSGKLDLLDIDAKEKTLSITDYKTGKAAYSWTGKTDFEKIKLHKYRQQLMFYELLVRHSRLYHAYTVRSSQLLFVEPTKAGDIRSLEAAYTSEELEIFTKLVIAIWKKIQAGEFTDTSGYEQSYNGILAFEHDLVDENI